MTVFDYALEAEEGPVLGLIVLQTDERIELDFRRLLPRDARYYVSRVPSGLDVTPQTLQQMQDHIPVAAGLLPAARRYDVIGYGCTSGAAQIGPDIIARQVRQGADVRTVTEPLSALSAACNALGIVQLAFLSPYIEAVSARLRASLRDRGIETPVFGSFAEAEEARVARISPASIARAVRQLVQRDSVDGVFLSCTNLDTLDIMAPLEAEIGLPVLSSNLVLAWHMCQLAGLEPSTPLSRRPAAVPG